jgi:hypothetical protein
MITKGWNMQTQIICPLLVWTVLEGMNKFFFMVCFIHHNIKKDSFFEFEYIFLVLLVRLLFKITTHQNVDVDVSAMLALIYHKHAPLQLNHQSHL